MAVVATDQQYPCSTQEDSKNILMEPLSEKTEQSKCCVDVSIYLLQQINAAVHMDQDPDNIVMLADYMGKSNYMTSKYCLVLGLKLKPCCTIWKHTVIQQCIWHAEAIIENLKHINTCIQMFPVMRCPQKHDNLYKLLGQKINKVLQTYLITIEYWFKTMSLDEHLLYF